MNIFALDQDPKLAAQYHCDKHVPKMILESLQILNGALYERDLSELAFYGYTHKHHPCTLWAAESWQNFEWVVRLAHHLNKEYKMRYDHDESHTSYQKMVDNWHDGESWTLPATDDELKPFALAMADDVKSSNRIQAYRDYYREYKQPQDWFCYEQGRDSPDWL